MDVISIIEKAREVSKALKKNDSFFRDTKKSSGIPDLHETYAVSVMMKESIEIHAVAGKKPDKLVAERAPNQTDREFEYSINTYQQITLPIFIEFINTYGRAFADNNWSVDWRGYDGSDSLQEYCEKGIKQTSLKLPLEEFVFQVLPTLRTIDAMGCLCVKPDSIPLMTDSEGNVILEDGKPIVSNTELFEPTVVYYPSEKVVAYQEGEWFMFLTDEKSEVEYGGKKERSGLIFEYYDKGAIYRVVQYGKKIDYTFNVIIYTTYDFNEVPVTRLLGIPYVHEGKLIHQSLFLFAVPNLNEVIIDSVMLRNIKASCVFPFLVMNGDMCNETMILNGETLQCGGRGYFMDLTKDQRIVCSGCNGTGMKDRLSPLGRMLLKAENPLDPGELKTTQPAMYYVSPSTETPGFLRTEIDSNLEKARNILHLRTSNTQVKGSTDLTATGMVLDEKALYSAVKLFSDQNFLILEFCYHFISLFRYGNTDQVPVVNRSINFDFNTEYEYMERISLAIKNGLPPFAVYEIVYRYLQTMFYNQLETASAFELITKSDRLLVMNTDDIMLKLSKGLIENWEVVLHDSGISIIKNILETDKGLFAKPFEVQQQLLIEQAKLIATQAQNSMSSSAASVAKNTLALALNPPANPAA